MANYKIIKKMDDGVVIELDRYGLFDWIYFSTSGLDIGKNEGYTSQIMRHIPVDETINSVKIEIKVLPREE